MTSKVDKRELRKSHGSNPRWQLSRAARDLMGTDAHKFAIRVFVILLFACACGCGGKGKGNDSDARNGDPSTSNQSSSNQTELPDIPPIFEEVGSQLGVTSQLQLGPLDDFFFPDIMCGGAAFLDFNGDERLDILLIGAGKRRELSNAPSGSNPTGANRLYVQLEDGSFSDVTEDSGLGDENYGMGVAIGDINNDGLDDVYFSNYGPDRLFLNRGDGTFKDISESAGIDNPHWSASATMVDVNLDGMLDIYVTNYVDYHPSTQCTFIGEVPDFCSPAVFSPVSDRLFINQGVANETSTEASFPHFVDATQSSGIGQKKGPGLGVACGDWNRDGWPDIYVANDGAANYLWVNEKDGTFSEQAIFRGCAFDNSGLAQAGMGIARGDAEGNGHQALFVTHLDQENNALYVADQSGVFSERASQSGLASLSKPMTGFGTAFVDLDLDRDLDLIVMNGRVTARDGSEDRKIWDRYREVNQIFWQTEDHSYELRESRNESLTTQWEVSRACCVGDIDNDGKVDLLITNADGPARLFRNVYETDAHWLGVSVVLPELGGRIAFGAEVRLVADGAEQTMVVGPGQSYCSSHDPRLVFGLADTSSIEFLEVIWPGGEIERFHPQTIDAYFRMEKGSGKRQESSDE